MKRDNEFFKSLIEQYDMSDEGDLDALTAEYKTYITNFFSGLADISEYMVADPLQEILDAIDQSPIDQVTEQFARFDKQIDFLVTSLDDLTGQEYATAIQNIGQLLTERYQLEIQYITQLSSMLQSAKDSLAGQQQGYMLEQMTPTQQTAYWAQQKQELWTKFWNESDPTKAAELLTQWQYAVGQHYQLLPEYDPTITRHGGGGQQPRATALEMFNTAMEAATGKLDKEFGDAIDDVIDAHNDTAAAVAALGIAIGGKDGTGGAVSAINNLTLSVGAFIERLNELSPSEVGVN